MRARALFLCAVLALGACGGGGGSGSAQQPGGPLISAVAPRQDPADVEVARVDGRPVWGSCVTAQAAHGARTREAALDECVSFELLAQAAERRGLATDPMVVEATRSALVNRMIEIGFEPRYQKPSDLGDVLTKWLATNAWRMHRPELRTSAYARVNLPNGATIAQDARAKALADKLAASLANETGLFGANLRDAADALTVGSDLKIEVAAVAIAERRHLDKHYADALFAIPDVGRVSPTTRTPWGWDVILMTSFLPEKEFTQDEIAVDMFEEARRGLMTTWVNELIKEHGIRVELEKDQIAKLEGSKP